MQCWKVFVKKGVAFRDLCQLKSHIVTSGWQILKEEDDTIFVFHEKQKSVRQASFISNKVVQGFEEKSLEDFFSNYTYIVKMLSGACFDSYNHVGNQARLACDCKVVFINSRDEILLIAKREINYLPLLLIIGVDTISLKENVCLESR